MNDYKEELQAFRELEVRVDRVKDILLVRLPKLYKSVFGEELDRSVIQKAINEKLAELKGKTVKEALTHLTEEDIMLAVNYVLPAKDPVPPERPEPPKPRTTIIPPKKSASAVAKKVLGKKKKGEK